MKPHKLVCLLFVSLNSEKGLKNHQHFVFEKQFVVLRRLMKLFTACIEFTKSTKHYRLCVDNDSLDRKKKNFQLFNLGSITSRFAIIRVTFTYLQMAL